ncbi:MAG: sigma-70 family RNA polymerase sigma factor [Firmicutes bacterium]|nr:sigma-70 family RNA polymerase sigma factor [Bacillota bacterium]
MDAKDFNEFLKSEKGIVKIFHEYYPKLVISALKFFKCRSISEDIAQEVMMKLIELTKNKDQEGEYVHEIKNPDAYLAILVRNISLNKKKKDARMEFSEDMVLSVDEKNMFDNEIKKWDFQKMFELLSDESKKIYQMHYEDDLSIKTIASKMGLAEGTIKWKLHKLREEVKKITHNAQRTTHNDG